MPLMKKPGPVDSIVHFSDGSSSKPNARGVVQVPARDVNALMGAGYAICGPAQLRTASSGVTLAPATAAKIASQSFDRVSLILQVTGAASFGFGAAPAAGTGISLDGASAAGGQGGSYQINGDATPSDEIWAISTPGTTVTVVEGFSI
jgi:hypothetical protein